MEAECAAGIPSERIVLGRYIHTQSIFTSPFSLVSFSLFLAPSSPPSLLPPSLPLDSLPIYPLPPLPPFLSLSPCLPPPSLSPGGFSQGGSLAIYSALTYPKRLAGIVGLSTYVSIRDILEKVRMRVREGGREGGKERKDGRERGT